MQNVAVPEIALDQADVFGLVGECKAEDMTHHVGINGHWELSPRSVLAQRQVDGRAVQGLAVH